MAKILVYYELVQRRGTVLQARKKIDRVSIARSQAIVSFSTHEGSLSKRTLSTHSGIVSNESRVGSRAKGSVLRTRGNLRPHLGGKHRSSDRKDIERRFEISEGRPSMSFFGCLFLGETNLVPRWKALGASSLVRDGTLVLPSSQRGAHHLCRRPFFVSIRLFYHNSWIPNIASNHRFSFWENDTRREDVHVTSSSLPPLRMCTTNFRIRDHLSERFEFVFPQDGSIVSSNEYHDAFDKILLRFRFVWYHSPDPM